LILAFSSGAWELQNGCVKAVYVAPNKALVQERVADWKQRFSYLGIQVLECTGDTDRHDEAARLMTADLIATTP
jgi:ATP-dependent DNA helicase HFM1/MER3